MVQMVLGELFRFGLKFTCRMLGTKAAMDFILLSGSLSGNRQTSNEPRRGEMRLGTLGFQLLTSRLRVWGLVNQMFYPQSRTQFRNTSLRNSSKAGTL